MYHRIDIPQHEHIFAFLPLLISSAPQDLQDGNQGWQIVFSMCKKHAHSFPYRSDKCPQRMPEMLLDDSGDVRLMCKNGESMCDRYQLIFMVGEEKDELTVDNVQILLALSP